MCTLLLSNLSAVETPMINALVCFKLGLAVSKVMYYRVSRR